MGVYYAHPIKETEMSETNKPDIVKASMEHKGMRVWLSRGTNTGYRDAKLEIETPEGSTIVIRGEAVSFLKNYLYWLGKVTE